MVRTMFVLAASILASLSPATAQQPKVYRVGVITSGGAWYETIDELRVGLKQLVLKTENKFLWYPRYKKVT